MAIQNKNRKTGSKKKLRSIALVVLLLVVAVIGSVVYFHHKNTSNDSPQSASTKLENKLDKQQTDAKGSTTATGSQITTKQATGDSQSGTTTSTTGSNVTPLITYFGKSDSQVEVDAFVPTITESGTCTLTITNGSATVTTQTKPAHPNAQSTTCENFLLSGTGASSSWRAVVSYSSAGHSGTSQPEAFQN